MKILIVDLETGTIDALEDPFDPENCVICEIGIVSLDICTGETSEIMNTVCKENQACHRDSWIFQNSSLSMEDVLRSVSLDDIRDELQSVLDCGKPVTSWGHGFDLRILAGKGYEIPLRFWDPLAVLAPFIRIPGPCGYSFKWPSVEEAHGFLRPWRPFRMAHRAAEDARMEASIIYDCTLRWPELRVDWGRFV